DAGIQEWIGQEYSSRSCPHQTKTHPVSLKFYSIRKTFIIQRRLYCYSVGKQIVNVPSFVVRLDSQKHIDFALTSPYGGGRPGRVKRKRAAAAAKREEGGEEEEE